MIQSIKKVHDSKSGSALLRGDRHKTSLLDGLAYDPEPLGAGARQLSKFKGEI
jgi:hypothetical protein